jgi:hypothetical protein
MEKEFVPYELALDLKQLGFDEPCFAYYSYDGDYILGIDEVRFDTISTYDQNSNLSEDSNACTAPLYQQAFRWFREKHNLFGQVNIHTYFIYNISNGDFKMVKKYDKLFETYEEAELECLKKLIEIVKGGNK